jgi:Ser/Thr protein kinase RdoA (MazF antagonist)
MDGTQLVHGLDGNWVEPDWPPLTIEEIGSLLERYPEAGKVCSILSVSPRPFSAASVIRTARGKVFVKRHSRAVRDRAGLIEEHAFVDYLISRGLPAPRVLRTADGASVVESGGWSYEVHEVPAGEDAYEEILSWTPYLSTEHARSAGRMLARLHRCAAGFDAPARRPSPLTLGFGIFSDDDPRAAFEQYIGVRPALKDCTMARTAFAQAAELLAPFHQELRPLLPALEPLWTHNDLHGSNLLWSDRTLEAEAVAIIDFGLADRTTAVHDLAQAIERSIGEWLLLKAGSEDVARIPVHYEHLNAMLDGYEAVRPLSAAEAAALAPMTALCHAEFALTEADYFHGPLHSEEKTRVALEEYLVGRARWFARGQGSELVEFLRQRARQRSAAPVLGNNE